MEYAIDKNGNRIHHSDAKDSNLYKCPHCLEQVFIRRDICFCHKPIRDRTPLQRTCPEYHENNSYKKIDDELDIIYINNGGIPLYLCNEGKRFQLRAYFPMVSKKSFNKLKQMGAKIHVNTKAYSEIDRKIYNIDNLNFYPVNTIEKWIDVKCEPNISRFEEDVKRKWLWGIRGVDIENDIYHSNKDGGYRVALKANINVGKTYRIMFDKYPPKIEGINFQKAGEILLREKSINKLIGIYEMNIENFTEQARNFIEGKGYKLAEKSNELLLLWPPAAFKGSEITFNERRAFFLYINISQKERLHFMLYNELFEVVDDDQYKSIIPIQINENKSILISYEDEERFNSEIKYNILYKKSLIEKKQVEQQITIKDSNNIEVNLNKENLVPPKDGKLYINSNVPFCATVSNENYVISSSSTCFENVNYLYNLTINSKGFGIKSYTYEKESYQTTMYDKLDWELEYSRLYRCNAPTAKANSRYFQLLYLLSQNINEKNIQLYRLLENWIKTNSIPISAIKYMDEIFERLGGMANGQ
ncbi:hypothetical protein [Sporanaerobacter acetigenes]|uniref:hypothetical protein n=1 Tax=Sporanaerobacter acetigenes TaxID=165813 RepID=UPI0033212E6E